MSKVSFGALAKAQDAISKQQSADRKRKRGDESSKSQEDKLQALRERLQEIKAAKLAQGGSAQPKSKARKTQSSRESVAERQDDDDDDDSGSDSDAAPHARSSKHAPAVQSSKRAVTRKRQVVDAKKPKFRDPRFDTGPPADENTLSKRYGFLNDYKESEMNDLREAIKKTKNETDKEKLKKKLTSMESQQKAQRNKDQQHGILQEHRKKEKELIKQGKKPFFLKKCQFLNSFLLF
jgi:ribosomal RNA-processing protein 36